MTIVRALCSILFCALVALCSAVVQARSLEEIEETGVLVVAVYEDFSPFSYRDQDDKGIGIDVDIANAIAKELGVSLELYWLQADETLDDDLRNAIWKGHLVSKQKADIMMRVPYDVQYNRRVDPVTGEPKNEQVVIMAPYQTESWSLLADSDYIPAIPAPAVLVKQRIAVEVDALPYTFFNFAMRGIFRNTIAVYPNTSKAVDDFVNSEVTAIADTTSRTDYLAYNINQLAPDFADQLISFPGTTFLTGQKANWEIGIAVHSNHRFMGYTVRKLLNKWVEDGFMKQIFARYGVAFVPPAL